MNTAHARNFSFREFSEFEFSEVLHLRAFPKQTTGLFMSTIRYRTTPKRHNSQRKPRRKKPYEKKLPPQHRRPQTQQNQQQSRPQTHRRHRPQTQQRQRPQKQEKLSPQHVQWLKRAREAHAQGGFQVIVMTPKQVVNPMIVSSVHHIKTLMWAHDETEIASYYKWSLHPQDCEYRILEAGRRHVYMCWKPLNISESKNINIPASRILLENNMIEPPIIEIDETDLMRYTHCFPADQVIFHQTIDDVLTEYTMKQFMADWPFMFPKEAAPAYRRLASERYQHYSQALTEYEHTSRNNPLVKSIITQYMGKRVGPVSHWDQAQLAVLGAAMLHMYKRDWDLASSPPRVTRVDIFA